MTPAKLKEKLNMLGFVDISVSELSIEINNYKLSVTLDKSDTSKSTINYGPDIKVWHKASSKFHQDETLVVLECVIRLLEKGYS